MDPAAPRPGTPAASSGNRILDNAISGNLVGCGIVAAAYNPGEGLTGNTIEGNTVTDNPAGIVVAADLPATSVQGTLVTGNTGTGSGLPGIIVHSNSAGDVVSGTAVRDNTLSGNGPDPGAAGGAGPGRGVGRALIAEPLATGSPAGAAPAVIRGTVLTGNLSTAEGYGSWLSGAPDSMVSGNSAGAGVEPVDGVGAASGLQEVP